MAFYMPISITLDNLLTAISTGCLFKNSESVLSVLLLQFGYCKLICSVRNTRNRGLVGTFAPKPVYLDTSVVMI